MHVLALVVRGSPGDRRAPAAVPREVLLSHPELAAALAGARIFHGSPTAVRELAAAAKAGANRLPRPRAERLRVMLDLVEMGHARFRGDLLALVAATHRVPDDARTPQ